MTNSFFDVKFNGLLDIVSLADLIRNDDKIDKNEALEIIIEELIKAEESRKNTIQELEQLSASMKKVDSQHDDFKKLYCQMLKVLDESNSRMETGDRKLAETQCSKLYGNNWSKLSQNSKQFLITAYFIRTKLKEAGLDFAPAIIEMCRAYENEIKGKIFSGYMNEIPYSRIDAEDNSILGKAIANYFQKGTIDLSLKQMLIELSRIKSSSRTTLQGLLFTYVQNQGWNANSLSNDPFIRESLIYVDKFRNDAAHTTPFNESDSEKCQTYTEKRIRQFLSYKKF